ncbi:YcaO-like family protein [Lentzea sp. NPDC034063]|uniref:YcaO-like family protein n=1 Tax=unclassified Lentzea TaxID=2643253 RepID=UPI0033D480CF
MSAREAALELGPHDDKVFLDGTHRIRRPEDTWRIIEPHLRDFGITRVADVTGLDTLGIPVTMAVRPRAKSLSVSQGKGQTLLLARVSAAMESIELWHAEHVKLDRCHVNAPSRAVDLPYRIEDLVTATGGLASDLMPLDWVAATGMISGLRIPVPDELVRWSTDRGWRPRGLEWSTNGLASGNSVQEAALHALFEIVERDAISRNGEPGELTYVDPASVDDELCSRLIEKVRAADARVDLSHLPSRFGVPCFGARIWSPDFPVMSLGWGAHPAPEIALSRAITEAAQSRLGGIAGTRDDLPAIYDTVKLGNEEPPPPAVVVAWQDLPDVPRRKFTGVKAELDWISCEVTNVIGREPLLVDLTTIDEIAVVKVIVPGVSLNLARVHPGA